MSKHLISITVAIITSVWVATSAFAAPADVPETGQTLCYNSAIPAAEITCAGTGQDGDLKAGVAWPSPRFVVGTGTEAGCVIDLLTGLMWVRAPGYTYRNWSDALSYAEGLSFCGHDDWRLPNVKELRGLVHLGKPDSAHWSIATWLNDPAQGFQSVESYYYWTSTTVAGNAANAWFVDFDNGFVDMVAKTDTYAAWPVRGGP